MERDSDGMFLGAVLRRARIAAGITSQDELADRLGYERTVMIHVIPAEIGALVGLGGAVSIADRDEQLQLR